MKLLNLACGNVRPQSTEGVEWVNLDNLHSILSDGSPERRQLDSEDNYRDWDLLSCNALPFGDETFDGIVCSHFVEHLNCQESVNMMRDCLRLLKSGGILMASVPDASYFRKVHAEDTVENAVRLFGEPIHLPDGEDNFMGYALFNKFHKTVLTEDSLWCYFTRAGFSNIIRYGFNYPTGLQLTENTSAFEMRKILNRLPFSLVMTGVKP